MKYDIRDAELVRNFSGKLGGVFTISDLSNMFGQAHKTALYRRIRRLESLNILTRFSRGVYVSKDFNPEILSQRLAPESYISFGNALADARIIGSSPQYQVDAVKIGKSRVYSNGAFTVRQFGCTRRVFFGFFTTEVIHRAIPEKAFLDTLYFYQHGVRFHFDIYSDVNMDLLNKSKIDFYLSRYKNPKFVQFVKWVLK